MAKRITKSKTFWVNLIAGVGSVLGLVVKSDLVVNNPQYAAYGVTAMAVINLVLRFVTKEPVKVGK